MIINNLNYEVNSIEVYNKIFVGIAACLSLDECISSYSRSTSKKSIYINIKKMGVSSFKCFRISDHSSTLPQYKIKTFYINDYIDVNSLVRDVKSYLLKANWFDLSNSLFDLIKLISSDKNSENRFFLNFESNIVDSSLKELDFYLFNSISKKRVNIDRETNDLLIEAYNQGLIAFRCYSKNGRNIKWRVYVTKIGANMIKEHEKRNIIKSKLYHIDSFNEKLKHIKNKNILDKINNRS
ncbi:hypothetical protein OKW22_000512 [Bacilli bacterium PM5-3]|nr:hypothetical protein [Bacilli bacterium PM5-3]